MRVILRNNTCICVGIIVIELVRAVEPLLQKTYTHIDNYSKFYNVEMSINHLNLNHQLETHH